MVSPVSAFMLAVMVTASATAGVVVATTYQGQPSMSGYLWTDDYTISVVMGYVNWANTYEESPNGTAMFSNTVLAFALDLESYPQSLSVDTDEQSYGWTNQTVTLQPRILTEITIPTATDSHWRGLVVVFDGVKWHGSVAVPYSILPLNDLNIGGLDVLVVAVLYQTVALFVGVTLFARWCARRTLWVRPFSMLTWGHVAMFTGLVLILGDYQWVDQTFAGWSPLVYAFVAAPLWWLWILPHFNKATQRLYAQAVPRPSSRMAVRLYALLIGKLPNGDVVAIRPNYRGWWARLAGKHAILRKHDDTTASDFTAEVLQDQPLDVVNPETGITARGHEPITEFGLLRTGLALHIQWSKLRRRPLPPRDRVRTHRDGSVTTERIERKTILPHWTDCVVSTTAFGSAQEVHVLASMSEWMGYEESAEMLAAAETELVVLRSAVNRLAEELKRASLRTWYSVQETISREATEAEAQAGSHGGRTATDVFPPVSPKGV